MPEERLSVRERLSSLFKGGYLAIGLVVLILFLIIPLNKTIIDIAMVLNLAMSFVIMITVIYMKRAADFTSYPRVVLIMTIFGLAINVASTRNILFHPVTSSGTTVHLESQSEMVQAFANIVAGSNVILGVVIFVILIIVQMLVITKGADRVSEVSARFTLDSMNNKMFDIQNDLNAGIITEEEAALKKKQIRQEVDFYSAMDGSTKFVSGNVKAGIVITVINLIGGFAVGMIQGKLSAQQALDTYAKLTIGDGLMSQIPSLILSFSTGLLVTGSSSEQLLSEQLKEQFSKDGLQYIVVGAILAVLGIAFHNLASLVLIPIGGLLVFIGVRLRRAEKAKRAAEEAKEAENKALNQKGSSPEDISPVINQDPLTIDIGIALIPLVEKEKGAELLERIPRIRKESALNLGLVVPQIRIRDNMSLEPEEYVVKIWGNVVGRSKLKMGHYMCLNTGNVPRDREIKGEPTEDPAFKMKAIWIPESKRTEAENAGYAVIDLPTIIATHLTEIIRKHAADIINRQDVDKILQEIKKTNPVVVDEVLTGENKLTVGDVERVFKNLLEEQVSIRNTVKILETLADCARYTKDLYMLTEKVRESIGQQICNEYVDSNSVLHVLRLSQQISQLVMEHGVQQPGEKPFVAFDPETARAYLNAVTGSIAAVKDRGYLPVIICPSQIRYLVKSVSERECPGIVVLSVNEVMAAGNSIKVEEIGEIELQ